jgi:hypothetical protein
MIRGVTESHEDEGRVCETYVYEIPCESAELPFMETLGGILEANSPEVLVTAVAILSYLAFEGSVPCVHFIQLAYISKTTDILGRRAPDLDEATLELYDASSRTIEGDTDLTFEVLLNVNFAGMNLPDELKDLMVRVLLQVCSMSNRGEIACLILVEMMMVIAEVFEGASSVMQDWIAEKLRAIYQPRREIPKAMKTGLGQLETGVRH